MVALDLRNAIIKLHGSGIMDIRGAKGSEESFTSVAR